MPPPMQICGVLSALWPPLSGGCPPPMQICGVTTAEDAHMAASAGANFIGGGGGLGFRVLQH